MDYNKAALEMHESHKGKVGIVSKVEVKTRDDLSTAYTPGVAEPCRKIKENPDDVYKYTFKSNMVAVVSNGTAVLGLGDIGPEAGLPVMEGKAVLFKEFGGVDAFPICIDAHDAASVIAACKAIAPTFGGINLEDIKAPECFYIEEVLKKEMNIPVFHDDQHGTAIISGAGLINALEITGKKAEDFIVVVSGAGAAAIACAKFYTELGIDPATGKLPEGVAAQTEQSLKNIRALLAAAGAGIENVVKTTVFITNMAQYAIRGYAVGALDYVLKPVPYFAFSQQLQKALGQLEKRERHYLAVAVDGGMRRLDAAEIYYLESEGHKVHFYTEKEDFVVPGTLKNYEEKLVGRAFARCNSGYLVNLAQVSGVQQDMVQVGPYTLQISRPRRKAFMAGLADYIGGAG